MLTPATGCATVIENPQPAWLPLLLLALPGIGFAAYALNQTVFPRGEQSLCTIPAIGLVLALLPTHLLGLASGSLAIGLAGAWSIIGAAGYAWIIGQWRGFRAALSAGHAGWARTLGIAALATTPIVLPTILANFNDEANYNGHFAIIAHLQNGTYPPRYLYEPSLPLRYHYAFDLAGAIVTGLLRLRLDHAIDLLTLALWPCMFLLLWRVGESVGGSRRAGLFAALTVCFSGGWPALALVYSPCGQCSVNHLRINPPFIDYFFQHPWSIGVPIFCLVLLQRAALPRLSNRALGVAALVCSLSLLALAQAVLFVTTVVALGLTEAWRLVRFRNREAVNVFLALGASLLIARLIGGFFVAGPFPPSGGILDTGFYLADLSGPDAVLGQAQWDLVSFGALLVLGVLGLLRVRNDKAFLTMLATLGLIIVNSLHYKHTWDIVKFGTVSFIVLAIGAGVLLSDFVGRADTFFRRGSFVVLVIAVAGQGAPYPFTRLLANYNPEERVPFSMQMIKPYFSSAYPVDRDNARAVSFLRAHMGPSEIAYRTEEKSEPYAIWAGLPTQTSVYSENGKEDDAYGLGEKKLAARRNLRTVSENWFDRLAAENISWVVTDSGDAAINSILECPEGQRRAVLLAHYGEVRVYHLHGR